MNPCPLEIQVQSGPARGHPQGAVSQVLRSQTSTFPSDPAALTLQWLNCLDSSASAQLSSALGFLFLASDRLSISSSVGTFTFCFRNDTLKLFPTPTPACL